MRIRCATGKDVAPGYEQLTGMLWYGLTKVLAWDVRNGGSKLK
jgi:hypothetical protein